MLLISLLVLCGIIPVTPFAWYSCGTKRDLANITDIKVTQKESLVIALKLQGQLKADINGPITVDVGLKKKVFWGWYQLPCDDGFGTCRYTNVCELSPYSNSCPSSFDGLPCYCPVKMGNYSGSVPIDMRNSGVPDWLVKGLYRIRVNIYSKDIAIACVVATSQLNFVNPGLTKYSKFDKGKKINGMKEY